MNSWLGGAAAVLLAVGLGGCQTWQCDAATCVDGCCDSGGMCVLNGGAAQCGRGGQACQSCSVCNDGACGCHPGFEVIDRTCACTARSCPGGCCASKGCLMPALQDDSSCGVGVGECKSCYNNGMKCSGGSCVPCVGAYQPCSVGGMACCYSYQCTADANGHATCQY